MLGTWRLEEFSNSCTEGIFSIFTFLTFGGFPAYYIGLPWAEMGLLPGGQSPVRLVAVFISAACDQRAARMLSVHTVVSPSKLVV